MKLRVPKHAKPGECAVTPDELAEYAEGLICLTGADDGPLARAGIGGQCPPLNGSNGFEEAQSRAEWVIDVFGKGNVYAELQRHFNREQEARNQAVTEIARRFDLPLLATNGVCHASPARRSDRRFHLHPKSCATGNCRPITGDKFRALSEIPKGNEAVVCRSA